MHFQSKADIYEWNIHLYNLWPFNFQIVTWNIKTKPLSTPHRIKLFISILSRRVLLIPK